MLFCIISWVIFKEEAINNQNISTRFNRFYRRLTGSTIEYNLTIYNDTLNKIKQLKTEFTNETDEKLQQISKELFHRAQNGESLDNLLVESYALVCETARRTIKLNPFDVQIVGGIVLHQGKLAEMQTGEGKTLVAVLPAYLNALTSKGVHILTFNDYLAHRDAEWMRAIYNFLGLSVGHVQEGMSVSERKQAYEADITYISAKEAGFDFLRDSICYHKDDIVHRSFNFAIIDEADSILIDEARIPLVIAGTSDFHDAELYHIAQIASKLKKEIDFKFDEYARSIYLTDAGLERAEELLSCENLHDTENLDILTRLNCAIHAEFLLHNNIDYIVRNEKIELVDEFTGRVADKRRWPDGLQAALEAKENITIQSRGIILNSTTLQHFLQNYPKICGMTATAQSAEEEFKKFYNLNIVVIPPNRFCIRVDHPDRIFVTKREKNRALLDEIIKVNETNRPILVGTCSVKESAILAEELNKQQIKCEVLNAKNDAYEASIVAQAGKLGAVIISTNMAGRGTDILLGGGDKKEKQKVMELGGLYVIGTNKHESQRIDNQLRGRAGRQGDPGSSCFIISLEDDIFIKYRGADLIPAKIINDNKNGEISNSIVRKEINSMQRIIEGQNSNIKITLYNYSWLVEKKRKIIEKRRLDILNNHASLKFFKLRSPRKYKKYELLVGNEKLTGICEYISLYYIDKYWSQFLAEIADIREGIHLRRIGGQVPLIEYQKLAISLFDEFLSKLDETLVKEFNRLPINNRDFTIETKNLKAPSATWTYLVSDNLFENQFGFQLTGNIGLSIGAAFIFGPLLGIALLKKKFKRKS
ncbi:MAG: accessory Sec system translocase SecA2 [Actinomycetota bacterium]